MQNPTLISEAVAAWLSAPLATFAEPPEALTAVLEAFMPAVPLPVAQKMLAGKARSEMYRVAGNGRLEFVKDHGKTLVTTRSIRNYQRTQWKPLIVKPVVKKSAKPKASAAAKRLGGKTNEPEAV